MYILFVFFEAIANFAVRIFSKCYACVPIKSETICMVGTLKHAEIDPNIF